MLRVDELFSIPARQQVRPSRTPARAAASGRQRGRPPGPFGCNQGPERAGLHARRRVLPTRGLAQPSDLSVIHQPVLVANGESDKMVPTKNSAALARRLPDSELVTYPDAGHGGIFQFHAQFVHKALEFLGR